MNLTFVLFAVRALEKAKITGNFAAETCEVKSEVPMPGYNDTESESSDSEASRTVRQTKKLKVAGLHHWPMVWPVCFNKNLSFLCN